MKTNTFTVANPGGPDAIIVDHTCTEIEIWENALAGTTDYDVYAPSLGDTPVRHAAGTKTKFSKTGTVYLPGEIAGYVNAVTAGTYTFAKEER